MSVNAKHLLGAGNQLNKIWARLLGLTAGWGSGHLKIMAVLCNRMNSAWGPLCGRVWGNQEKLLGVGHICSSEEWRAGWAEGTANA